MDNNIQHYRQPLVTSIGIILGFVIGFLGKWATDPAEKTSLSDYMVSISLTFSIILLITALYRILNNNYPKENAAAYYRKTLKTFIWGLVIAFIGVIVAINQSLISH